MRGTSLSEASVKIFRSVYVRVVVQLAPQLQQVWDKQSYTLKTSLQGHTGSILALELVEQKGWLFSASGRNCILL